MVLKTLGKSKIFIKHDDISRFFVFYSLLSAA